MSPTNSQMQKEETKRNLHQVEAGLSRAGCFSHPPLIGTPTSTCSPDGKTVKSMDSCWTSRSPSDSSLLWLALVFLGIHSFQSRQVFGRTGLWRRLRFIYSYKMMCLFFFFFLWNIQLPPWMSRVVWLRSPWSPSSELCCSMTALHLTAFTFTRDLSNTWLMAPESSALSTGLLQGPWQTLGWKEKKIWDERKHATSYLQYLLGGGLCICWQFPVVVLQGAKQLLILLRLVDAGSTWERWDMDGIKSDPLHEAYGKEASPFT